jgi:hypothetical protein
MSWLWELTRDPEEAVEVSKVVEGSSAAMRECFVLVYSQ